MDIGTKFVKDFHDTQFFRKFAWWRKRQMLLGASDLSFENEYDEELLSPQSRQHAEKKRMEQQQHQEQQKEEEQQQQQQQPQQQQLTPKSAWKEQNERKEDNKDEPNMHIGDETAVMETISDAVMEEEEYVHDFAMYAPPVVELVVRALADYERRDESELSMR